MEMDINKISLDIDIAKMLEEYPYSHVLYKVLKTFYNFLYIFPDMACEINDKTGNLHLIAYKTIKREDALRLRLMLGDDAYRAVFAEAYRHRYHDVLFLAKTTLSNKRIEGEKEGGKGKGKGKGKGRERGGRGGRGGRGERRKGGNMMGRGGEGGRGGREWKISKKNKDARYSFYRPISQKALLQRLLQGILT